MRQTHRRTSFLRADERTASYGQSGYSLVELMVATVVLSVVMAAAYGNLISQMRTYATERLLTETEDDARVAMRILTDQIEMAGFGVPIAATPSSATRIVTAAPTELSFWTKVTAAHTYLAAAAAVGATSIVVASATGLAKGQKIYVSDVNRWYLGTIQSISGSTVALNPTLTYAVGAGSLVTPVEQVTFKLVGTELQRNGKRFIKNVTGLTFAYDAVTPTAIRQITVTLSVQTRGVSATTRKRIHESLSVKAVPPNLAL